MGVRTKVLGGFAIVFAIGLILGLFGLFSTSRLTALSDEQYEIQTAGDSVTSVLNAHYEWRQTLTEAVVNMSAFTGSLDPTTCALGKWKDGDEAKKVSDPDILSYLKQLDAPHSYIHNEAKTVVAAIEAGNREEATRILTENILPRTKEAITILGAMETRYNELSEDKGSEAISLGNTMRFIIISLIAAALVVCVILAWLITSSIMKPISKMAQNAMTISTGDLNVQIEHTSNDEIGQLADAFQMMLDGTKEQVTIAQTIAKGDLTVSVTPRSDKDTMNIAFGQMLANLNNMFGNIYASTTQVSAGSKQIADGAQSLAQGSTQQAAAVEQLSSSVTEIADKTKENADMAEKAAKLSATIKQNAEKGNRQMGEMMGAVKEISEASQSINKVIKVIDDIAFQTNILALNAAVEAARAGQHGKGFAVVAEEVRNLAAKSAEAAKDTGGLIANSMEKAELGARIAGETAASLTEIVSGINESSQLVSEIARSSEEQSSGITQINRGIDQVAQVVQQNSATAEESAAASQEMSGQANILEELIAQFKLKSNKNQDSQYLPRSTGASTMNRTSSGSESQHFGKY